MQLVLKAVGLLPRSWIRAVSGARWRHPWLSPYYEWAENRFRRRDGVIQRGVGQGLRFNPGPSNAGYLLGTSEPAIQNFLAAHLKPGMTVYDAGANVGFLSVLAARLVGPEGRVICFEPLPSNANQIEHNARLNGFGQIVVRREALGLADGQTRFLVSPDSTMGKLADSSFAKPEETMVGEIQVTVRSLDRVVAEEGLPRPDLIKLDVEGVEGEVLRGGAETLRASRPILLVELHGTNAAVAAALGDLDYHASVLGTRQTIAEAAWNAYIIAVPGEMGDLIHFVEEFCASARDRR